MILSHFYDFARVWSKYKALILALCMKVYVPDSYDLEPFKWDRKFEYLSSNYHWIMKGIIENSN